MGDVKIHEYPTRTLLVYVCSMFNLFTPVIEVVRARRDRIRQTPDALHHSKEATKACMYFNRTYINPLQSIR